MATAGSRRAASAGRAAEDHALAALSAVGLRLLERNFRCRLGEIDLVMRDGDTLVFVEVRRRRSAQYGTAAESLTERKQQRLIAAARMYLRLHPQASARAVRFDLFAIDGEPPVSRWLRGVFAT